MEEFPAHSSFRNVLFSLFYDVTDFYDTAKEMCVLCVGLFGEQGKDSFSSSSMEFLFLEGLRDFVESRQ